MDPRLVATLLIAVLAPALAGCTGAPQAPKQADAPTTGETPRLLNATEASNVTSGDGPGEFQKSLDEKFHTHNYWGGALEKVLMDADVSATPIVGDPTNPRNGFFINIGGGRSGGGVGFTSFLLPEGSIVPPEAEKLEATVTWADSPTITGLRLGWSNASSARSTQASPFPAGGGTVTIPCDLLSNDIPHTSVSKWGFFLQPYSSAGPAIFNGTVHVKIKAFRNDTLYLAPPHPDFWGANTTLPLLNTTLPLSETYVAFVPVNGVLGFFTGQDSSNFEFVRLPNGTLVAPHTGVLSVTLAWKNNSTLPNPDDLHPGLAYVQAGSRGFFTPTGQRTGDRIVYSIPVDARHWDSPYQNQSQWSFVLFLTSMSNDVTGVGITNLGQFDGSVHLDVVAERESGA